jgi:hypothetical protein
MCGEVEWLWTGYTWAGFMWLRLESRVKLGYDEGAWVDVTQDRVLRKEIGYQNTAGFMWRRAICREFEGVHLAHHMAQ